jgi:hypothetical protein
VRIKAVKHDADHGHLAAPHYDVLEIVGAMPVR